MTKGSAEDVADAGSALVPSRVDPRAIASIVRVMVALLRRCTLA
jgi:hypothetical protein